MEWDGGAGPLSLSGAHVPRDGGCDVIGHTRTHLRNNTCTTATECRSPRLSASNNAHTRTRTRTHAHEHGHVRACSGQHCPSAVCLARPPPTNALHAHHMQTHVDARVHTSTAWRVCLCAVCVPCLIYRLVSYFNDREHCTPLHAEVCIAVGEGALFEMCIKKLFKAPSGGTQGGGGGWHKALAPLAGGGGGQNHLAISFVV